MPSHSPHAEYEISTDPMRLDVTVIHAFLTQSYWSPGIPRAVVERAISNSLCFGLYHKAERVAPGAKAQTEQVGFARVITDKATFAYLADVFILDAHRGRGLSKWLVQIIKVHQDLQGLRRFLLATRDAHRLYQQFEFRELSNPSSMMEIVKPDVYRVSSLGQ